MLSLWKTLTDHVETTVHEYGRCRLWLLRMASQHHLLISPDTGESSKMRDGLGPAISVEFLSTEILRILLLFRDGSVIHCRCRCINIQ